MSFLRQICKFNTLQQINQRSFSTSLIKLCKTEVISEVRTRNEEFTTIYKFPYIRALSLVNKLKIYQAFATGIGVPVSLILCNLGHVETEAATAVSILGITCFLAFFVVGKITERFIGFIYINKSEDKVKFSYIDFWGNRKDEIVTLKDVCTFSDLPVSMTDSLFYQLPRKSSKDCLKLNVRLGEIIDSNKFNKVFLPV